MYKTIFMLRGKTVILISCISFLLIVTPTLFAQNSVEAPLTIEKIEGELLDNSEVQVSGKVVNHLPWPVNDVHVEIEFQDGGKEYIGESIISQIESNGSVTFKIKQKGLNPYLATFSVAISDFTIRTVDVPGLFQQFSSTNSSLLRLEIVEAFNEMSEGQAVEALINCVQSEESISQALDKFIEDLFCLNGLYAENAPQSVEALLILLARYTESDTLDIGLFFTVGLEDSDSLLHVMQLKNIISPDGASLSTEDIIVSILQQMGPAGWPQLLNATVHESHQIQNLAWQMLERLELENAEAFLRIDDPKILREIVVVMGTVGYGDAVIPLIEMAVKNPDMEVEVTQSLASMRATAVPGLVSALKHPDIAVVEHADEFLRRYASEFPDALEIELLALSPNTPVPTNGNAMVTELRFLADQYILTETEVLFEQSIASYEAGDCLAAADAIFDILKIRNQIAHAQESAEILLCAARVHLESEDYEQAVWIGEQALRLFSDDEIAKELAGWLAIQGDKAQDQEKAFQFFRGALNYYPNYLRAYQGIGQIVVTHNLFYLVGGFIFLFIGLIFALFT